tara:strand:+ start:269 stop:757 length:489 start_codon:yes stop_codon:yes gene_type:complete
MGLTKDIENAFLKSVGWTSDVPKGSYPELAKDLADALVNFLQKQEFTITDMKAIVKLDKLETTSDVYGNVKSQVQAVIPSGMVSQGTSPAVIPNPAPLPISINTSSGMRGVVIPKLRLNKNSGKTGGNMNAVGYAYVGKNPVSPDVSGEKHSTVKLIEVKDK